MKIKNKVRVKQKKNKRAKSFNDNFQTVFHVRHQLTLAAQSSQLAASLVLTLINYI